MSDNKQIFSAMVKAQKAFGPALKASTNPHFKSRYADLAACVEAVVDALNEAGIALVQKQHTSEGGVCVETVFLHESGESFSAGLLTVPASKQDPQGYGSALTYARRYSLMAACGIAPEDDDGNAAKAPKPKAGVIAQVQEVSPPLSQGEREVLDELAQELPTIAAHQSIAAVVSRIERESMDDAQKIYLWGLLPSALRSAIKREQEAQRKSA